MKKCFFTDIIRLCANTQKLNVLSCLFDTRMGLLLPTETKYVPFDNLLLSDDLDFL